jgi:hypothetical protein
MNSPALQLTLIYVAIAALLLILCLATNWPRWIKAGAIIVVTVSYFFAQAIFHGMLGWPADEKLPEKFVLLATMIDEPDKKRGTNGAIYIWVNGFQENKPILQPRAYMLPYEKKLHADLGEAMKKSSQGIQQIGSADLPIGPAQSYWQRAGNYGANIKISDAPAPQLPEK